MSATTATRGCHVVETGNDMTIELSDLEKALGGRLARRGERELPGLRPRDGHEVVYYQDDGKTTTRKLFRTLLQGVTTPSAQSGGVVSDPCTIVVPDGRLFRAASYHGDVEGWRRKILNSACESGLLLARIQKDSFVVSDGSVLPLSSCAIKIE